jgi:leader peptidase (prepilin peptidase) / N-methyltransferase
VGRKAAGIIHSVLALCLAAVAFLGVGIHPPLFAALYLAAATPWLVTVDIREHRLPNVVVVPGIAAGLVSCGGEWIQSGRPPLIPVIAATAYVAFLLLLHAVGGMGMGDVKLGAALGLASWNVSVAVLSPVIAFLVGGVAAIALLVAGRRGTKIAFGPYLLGGYWAVVGLVAVVTAASFS